MIRPGIGYMHVTAFNETTEQEVEDALQGLANSKAWCLICAAIRAACE